MVFPFRLRRTRLYDYINFWVFTMIMMLDFPMAVMALVNQSSTRIVRNATAGVPIINHYTSPEQFKEICCQERNIYGEDLFP